MPSLADQFAQDVGAGAGQQGTPALSAQFAADLNGAPASPATPAGADPGYWATIGAGLGHGFGSTVLGAQQLLGHGAQALGLDSAGGWLTRDAEQGLRNLDAQLAPYRASHPLVASAGDLAGTGIATAPLMAFGPEMGALSLPGKIGMGAASGAAGALVAPVENAKPQTTLSDLITGGAAPGNDYWTEKAKQVAQGAGVGAVLAPVVSAAGRVISPQTGSDQARMLDAGVPLTPGQIAGGAANTLESKATSIPITGDVIRGAQTRAIEGFNRATYDQVLAPLGQKFSGPVGHEGVAQVEQTISNVYKQSLEKLTFSAHDPQFQADVTKLAGMAQNLPPAQAQSFANVLRTQIFGKLGPRGTMDGQTLQGVQSELSRLARGYSGDASFDNRQLGAALGEVKNAVDASLGRTNTAEAVADLRSAQAAWANYVRLRSAAASQGAMNNGGVITPAQLQAAVRAQDKSVGKGATATGDALMQDWSQAAMNAFGKSYPDSGTAGRLGTAGALGALLSNPSALLNPAVWAGTLPSLAYTTTGQRLAQALMTQRPGWARPLGNMLSGSGSNAAALSGALYAHPVPPERASQP